MRALSSGDLPAIRDNRNAWKIDPDALDAWAQKRPGPSPVTDRTVTENRPNQDQTTLKDTPETLARLAAAEAKIEGLEARLSDTQSDRDRLAGLLERALEPKPSLWERIRGRHSSS